MPRKGETTQKEEQYIFLNSSIQNLNEAHAILKTIKAEPKNKLKVPAFNYALILYSMPYGKSRGIQQNSHILPSTYIPKEFIDLHKKITFSRDKIYAHDDLTEKEAEINVFEFRMPAGKTFETISIMQNILKGELFPKIDEIAILIEKSLDKLIAESNRLSQEILKLRKITPVKTSNK